MNLKIHPAVKNKYPIRAVFIKDASPLGWLKAIEQFGCSITALQAYGIPGCKANQLYGCLFVFNSNIPIEKIPNTIYYQVLTSSILGTHLFIPEYSDVAPQITEQEWLWLFGKHHYFFHPEIGFTELTEVIDWASVISIPQEHEVAVVVPLKKVNIPKTIKSFSIEQHLDDINLVEEKKNTVDDKKLPFNMDKALEGNRRELDKLLSYLQENPNEGLDFAIPIDTVGATRSKIGSGNYKFGKSIFGNFFKLKEPSAKKTTPKKDKKFDGGGGISFGGIGVGLVVFIRFIIAGSRITKGIVDIVYWVVVLLVALLIGLLFFLIGEAVNKNWFSNSNFGGGGFGGSNFSSRSFGNYWRGNSLMVDDSTLNRLRDQYEKMAEDYIKQGDYKKAAHVYVKLLKYYTKGATVLYNAGLYAEAGKIYLEYCNNKVQAADCFAKANMYSAALDLYIELKMHERAADMYLELGRNKDANFYYNFVIDNYKKGHQYLKAHAIYKNKVGDNKLAQELLLEGWNKNIQPLPCLEAYFDGIEDDGELMAAIKKQYKATSKTLQFLKVIKKTYSKNTALELEIREIAYEIITNNVDRYPNVIYQLASFNKEDLIISNDIMTFSGRKGASN